MDDFLNCEAPGVGNTGVREYIIPKNKKSYSIDWNSCTFDCIEYDAQGIPLNKSIPFINDLLTILKSDYMYDVQEVELGGRYGYKSRLCVHPGVTLYFCGPENLYGRKTTFLDMTGRGCDIFNSKTEWFEFLSFMFKENLNTNFTRADFAIDDFYGEEISMDELFTLIKDGFFKRRGTPKSLIRWNINDINDYKKGCTVYLYSNASKVQLCIYNKHAEQLAKDNLENYTPQWVRYEMRFKKENAHEQMTKYYNILKQEVYGITSEESTGLFLSSSLFELLKLYEPTNDSNKSRWVLHDGWNNFIGDISKIEFERNITKKNEIIKTKEYFMNNYGKFLNKLYLCYDFDYIIEFIKQTMLNKTNKLEPEDIMEINDLRKKNGLEVYDNLDVSLKLVDIIVNSKILDRFDY